MCSTRIVCPYHRRRLPIRLSQSLDRPIRTRPAVHEALSISNPQSSSNLRAWANRRWWSPSSNIQRPRRSPTPKSRFARLREVRPGHLNLTYGRTYIHTHTVHTRTQGILDLSLNHPSAILHPPSAITVLSLPFRASHRISLSRCSSSAHPVSRRHAR